MKREDLKKLGLEDEAIDEVMAMHGQDIEKFKTDLEARENEVQNLGQQLSQAGEVIEGFKSMDVEGIKAAADEWKQKAEDAKKEAEEAVRTLKFDHALENSLREAKAKNPKAVRALLDLEKVDFDEDGKLKGLNEQLETVKTENDYLFESEKPQPKIVDRGENTDVMGDAAVSAARKGAGLPNH